MRGKKSDAQRELRDLLGAVDEGRDVEVHPKIAQARAGHASMAVTMDIYSHVTDSMQERAAERINQELQAALGEKV